MPLMNNNYVSPAWIDNAAPPINDDELNAMSQTLEGSQILVGSGAPTSSTPGKVGQRYADISTTPATMYELKQTNPNVWKAVLEQNANTARPYNTGSSYAAGDYCIHEGKLWKALDATGGAWDGSKWEQAKYADDLSGHEADQNNPHNVTAAQTGAVSPPVLATVQATTTAVRDYFAGEYFFYEGQLYEVKEAVAQGGDLFAERSPDGVTVYDLDTWYDAEAYDSNQPNAQVIKSGFQITSYRTSGFNQTMVESHAKYFYAWIQGENTTQSAVVYFSKNAEDIPSNNGAWVYYIDKPSEYDINIMYRAANSGGNTSGEYYFRIWEQPNPEAGFPYITRRPVNARMFTGTENDLFDFIGGMPQYKKSEPAVLGDGVTALHPKTGTVTIGTFWSGSGPYSQTVTVTGTAVTTKSKVDLTPTAAQLETLAADGVLSLTIENNGGTLTAWVVGTQPSAAMTVSCVVRETA